MTKTLTEQWKDGELPNGKYYVKDWDGTTNWFVAQNKILWRDLNNPIYASERIEVLAPVPSYKEYKRLVSKTDKLKKQLAIATNALKEYADRENYHEFDDDYDEPIWNIGSPIMHAELALKEMEGVK